MKFYVSLRRIYQPTTYQADAYQAETRLQMPKIKDGKQINDK